jgi:tRNA pseudouridine55 synthase
MYSAIKQGGRKLYDMARSGQIVEREARLVRIDSLELIEWSSPEFVLDVTCNSGTYIRSLAYDIGESLGVGAHLTALTRLASGYFILENAVSLHTLMGSENWQQHLIPPQAALSDWPAARLRESDVDHIRHGRAVPIGDTLFNGLGFAYSAEGDLIAIVQAVDGLLRPHKVFLQVGK